jgi:hypothetical protein
MEFDSSALTTNSYSSFSFNSIFATPEGMGSLLQQNYIQLNAIFVFSLIILVGLYSVEKLCYAIVFLAVINLFTGFFVNN